MTANPLHIELDKTALTRLAENTVRQMLEADPEGFDPSPFTNSELDYDDEARLAELITEVIGSLDPDEPAWAPVGDRLELTDLDLDISYDGEGLADGLDMRAWYRITPDPGTLTGPIHGVREYWFRRIRLSNELGGQTSLAGQLAAFVETMIARLNVVVDREWTFFVTVMATRPDPMDDKVTGQLIFDTETETVLGAQSALIIDPVELEARIDELDESYGTVNEALLDGDPKAVAIATELGRPVR